ncbi:GntR family transcriptional regulator [Microbacterium maritypicum]|uniref:GntR family transcriptional regulator n=1 Tax=Microbacterium maritypicum TaxID=33918 RepID=UPI003A8DB506
MTTTDTTLQADFPVDVLTLVDRADTQPAYAQIAAQIRAAIDDRGIPAGAQLPSEHELVDRFGVSRMTVREGIRVLRDEGLLRAAHGVGIFVDEPHPAPPLADVGLAISPTPAMKAGTQVIHQCSWCGAVVVWMRTAERRRLTNCPACRNGTETPHTTWWEQRLPVAGIHPTPTTQRSTTDD